MQAGSGNDVRHLWPLKPGSAYLNHGAFGVTPAPVLEAQAALRRRIEESPGAFFAHDYFGLMREAAGRVAAWLGVAGDPLVFVDNATAGVNAVLQGVPLGAGDEILVMSSTYGAIANAARYHARRAGATVAVAPVSFPPDGPDAVLGAVAAALRPSTRLAILDHVVSENGLVLPIADLVRLCRGRGVPVLVDGAHAPGQVPLDLAAIDADWYTANLHKWAFAPRSCGFLWARPERRAALHPTVISWGLDKGWTEEFDWVGTRDPTPWLTAPAALDFLGGLGAARVMAHNRALADRAAVLLGEALDVPCAVPDSMAGAMRVVPLPGPADAERAGAIRLALWRDHLIEAAVMPFQDRLWLRICAQLYNTEDEYVRLADAVRRCCAA